MTFHRPGVWLGARLAAIAVTALLCACAERDLPAADPSFYRSLATKDAQVDAVMAASMISGYRTNNGLSAVTVDPELMKLALAQALSGWRDSPPHRANMLLSGATRMGIAAAYAPKSKYKVFWALILAEPDERRG